MYKVFFKDRTLFFVNSIDDNLALNADAIYKYDTINQLHKFIADFLSKEHLSTGVVYSHDLQGCFDAFKSYFTFIQAAGGLVFNLRKKFVGIHRLGRNDLPKGKLEKGESAQAAAVREVKEECGLDNVTLHYRIANTYHIYFIDNTPVLKRTHWFKMQTDTETLTPQHEEDITDASWVDPRDIEQFIGNTYPSVRDVLEAAGLY
jgi:ADP-ribose pyrophosphatase YjhB (NUDIX family)